MPPVIIKQQKRTGMYIYYRREREINPMLTFESIIFPDVYFILLNVIEVKYEHE